MSNISQNIVRVKESFRMAMALLLSLAVIVSCNFGTGSATNSPLDETSLEDFDEDWAYEDILDESASEEMHGSICFDPYPEPEYWVEANIYEFLSSDHKSISQDAKFGPDAGNGTISLEAYPDSTFHAIFTRDSKRYDLMEEAGIADYGIEMVTLAAMDLNHDGNKELILHSGAGFGVYVFAVHKGKDPITYAGEMASNSGFFVTDNGTIVGLFGSQGGAIIARYENDQLIVDADGAWFDKALIGSPKFHNLEYDYEDTRCEDQSIKPLLRTEKYIVCEAKMLAGDHVLKIDLDSDGEEEQLYMSSPNWGATFFDIAQVNERFAGYDLTGPIYDNEDSIAMTFDMFDSKFNGKVQLSAVDIDDDGVYEVILSAGEQKLNSTYVFSYTKGEGVTLLKHIEHKGILKESDLR